MPTREELDQAIDEYAMAFAEQTIDLVQQQAKQGYLTEDDYAFRIKTAKKALAVVNKMLDLLGIKGE